MTFGYIIREQQQCDAPERLRWCFSARRPASGSRLSAVARARGRGRVPGHCGHGRGRERSNCGGLRIARRKRKRRKTKRKKQVEKTESVPPKGARANTHTNNVRRVDLETGRWRRRRRWPSIGGARGGGGGCGRWLPSGEGYKVCVCAAAMFYNGPERPNQHQYPTDRCRRLANICRSSILELTVFCIPLISFDCFIYIVHNFPPPPRRLAERKFSFCFAFTNTSNFSKRA